MEDNKSKLLRIINDSNLSTIGITEGDITSTSENGEKCYKIQIRASGEGHKGIDRLHELLANTVTEDILRDEYGLKSADANTSRDTVDIYVPIEALNQVAVTN